MSLWRGSSSSPGLTPDQATGEVEASIARLFSYGAWADKFEGRDPYATHPRACASPCTNHRWVWWALAVGERPGLLGLVSLIAPLIALGNRVVAAAR